MRWAKTSSADLSRIIQQLETEREVVGNDLRRLENLRDQFPEQSSKISQSISDWQDVQVELGSALAAIEEEVSDAFVDHQALGKDRDAELRRVYARCQTRAERVIKRAQALRSRVEPEDPEKR